MGEILHRVDGTDRGQIVGDRGKIERLDPLLVEEAGVQVADLLGLAAGLVVLPAQVVEQVAHTLLGAVPQAVEGAVARPVVGDLGPVEPRPVHVAEEVVLRADVGFAFGQVDPLSHGGDPTGRV